MPTLPIPAKWTEVFDAAAKVKYPNAKNSFEAWNNLSDKGDFARAFDPVKGADWKPILEKFFKTYDNEFKEALSKLQKDKDGKLTVDGKSPAAIANREILTKVTASVLSKFEQELNNQDFWKDIPPGKVAEYKDAISIAFIFKSITNIAPGLLMDMRKELNTKQDAILDEFKKKKVKIDGEFNDKLAALGIKSDSNDVRFETRINKAIADPDNAPKLDQLKALQNDYRVIMNPLEKKSNAEQDVYINQAKKMNLEDAKQFITIELIQKKASRHKAEAKKNQEKPEISLKEKFGTLGKKILGSSSVTKIAQFMGDTTEKAIEGLQNLRKSNSTSNSNRNSMSEEVDLPKTNPPRHSMTREQIEESLKQFRQNNLEEGEKEEKEEQRPRSPSKS